MAAPNPIDDIDLEILRCRNPAYFIHHYCKIRGEAGADVPFHLRPAQLEGLKAICARRQVAILKARQTGFTTLMQCLAVQLALYNPGWVTLLFSKSHTEAKELLARIRDTILKLPKWLQPHGMPTDTTTQLKLSNGSHFISFGSKASGGDSYTANLVVIDEADLIRNLDDLLSGAKPTIDGGGKLVLLSRTEKSNPNSSFKRIMRAALAGGSTYTPLFFPWWVHPARTRAWYEEKAKEIEDRTFSKDELYANYPATPEEALAARQLDKRFPLSWLLEVHDPLDPLPLKALGKTPFKGWKNLEIYKLPKAGRAYCCGVDVAGGNPNSDDSVCFVVDKEDLEEVAVLCGKIEPTVHAHRSAKLAEFYNRAEILPEKNHTHGTKCLEALKALKCKILFGHDHKPGWFTDIVRKNLMYDTVAEAVRTKQTVIHSKATLDQLSSLDVTELAAPFGQKDDRAVGYALAVQGCARRLKKPDLVIVTGEPGQAATQSAAGVRYIGAYDSWLAAIEVEGQTVELGYYDEERLAAAAVNAGLRLKGKDAPNVATLTEDEEAAIVARVEKLLSQHGGDR